MDNPVMDLWNNREKVLAENERLRAALLRIQEYGGYSVLELMRIAREALQQSE